MTKAHPAEFKGTDLKSEKDFVTNFIHFVLRSEIATRKKSYCEISVFLYFTTRLPHAVQEIALSSGELFACHFHYRSGKT
jgi:hypothetical protein